MCGCSSAAQRTYYYSRQSIEMRARLITRVSRVSHDAAPKSRWHRRHAPPGAAQRLSGDDIPPVAGFFPAAWRGIRGQFCASGGRGGAFGSSEPGRHTGSHLLTRFTRACSGASLTRAAPSSGAPRELRTACVARARPAGGTNVCAAERVCWDVFFFFFPVPSPEGARAPQRVRTRSCATRKHTMLWHQFFACA